MNRWIVSMISGAILITGAGLAKIVAGEQGPAFILGDRPVTQEQIRNRLMSEGWAGVQITQEGQYIRVTGSVNGQAKKLVIDARTGRLRAQADDDDDDDDN